MLGSDRCQQLREVDRLSVLLATSSQGFYIIILCLVFTFISHTHNTNIPCRLRDLVSFVQYHVSAAWNTVRFNKTLCQTNT